MRVWSRFRLSSKDSEDAGASSLFCVGTMAERILVMGDTEDPWECLLGVMVVDLVARRVNVANLK